MINLYSYVMRACLYVSECMRVRRTIQTRLKTYILKKESVPRLQILTINWDWSDDNCFVLYYNLTVLRIISIIQSSVFN